MFTKSARFYDLIYSWKDYAGESERLHELIQKENPGARSLLDVACGTGMHLVNLKKDYEAEGLDLNPELLAIAKDRHPEITFHSGDMTDFDIGARYDVVTCLFSSIGYVETAERLNRSVLAMARHLAPGGVLIVEPWFTPGVWEAGTTHALLVEEDELKIARVNKSDPAVDGVSVLEMHYLIGTPQEVSYFTETHRLGLFTVDEYIEAFSRAGLAVVHDDQGLMGRGLYIGSRKS